MKEEGISRALTPAFETIAEASEGVDFGFGICHVSVSNSSLTNWAASNVYRTKHLGGAPQGHPNCGCLPWRAGEDRVAPEKMVEDALSHYGANL